MIEIEQCDSSTVCRLSGDLDFANSLSLRHVISDLLGPGSDIVIDLRHAHSVDAVGLSALVGSVRRIRAFGGTAHIINAKPRVRWLMSVVGVDRLIAGALATAPPGAA